MRNWFGSEPGLGLITLLISVPIIGVLAYILISGTIDSPMVALPIFAAYGLSIGVLYIISKQRSKDDA